MPTMEVSDHEKMILYGLRNMMAENNNSQLKVVEDTYFAKSKQTIFTMDELASKWECSTVTVSRILKKYKVKPIGKRGKSHEFDLTEAVEAKNTWDGEALHQHDVSWKMRAMQ